MRNNPLGAAQRQNIQFISPGSGRDINSLPYLFKRVFSRKAYNAYLLIPDSSASLVKITPEGSTSCSIDFMCITNFRANIISSISTKVNTQNTNNWPSFISSFHQCDNPNMFDCCLSSLLCLLLGPSLLDPHCLDPSAHGTCVDFCVLLIHSRTFQVPSKAEAFLKKVQEYQRARFSPKNGCKKRTCKTHR